jgi:hypothetical protein
VPLRLCSPWRLAASLVLVFTAWVFQAEIEELISTAYLKIIGVEPSQSILTLLAGVEAGILGLVTGFLVRSPTVGALASLSILSGGSAMNDPWPPLLAAGIAGGALALAASLAGGPLEPLRVSGGRRDGLALALAATSTLTASMLGAPCTAYWASGALSSALASYILGYPEAIISAALAGLGWLGALVGFTVASLKAAPAPSCGGLEASIDAVLRKAPTSRIVAGPHSLWASWGFECVRGPGTLVPRGSRGSVLVAYGPEARLAASLVAANIENALVVCASCDVEYWKRLGFVEAHFRIGGEPPKIRSPGLLIIESERPWDYLLTAVAAVAPEGRFGAIIVDRADLVKSPRVLEAIVEEALEYSPLVVLVNTQPSRGPLVPAVADASVSIAIAGPVPHSHILDLLPLTGDEALEAVYEGLSRGYALFYPTCSGSVAAVRLRGRPILEHK